MLIGSCKLKLPAGTNYQQKSRALSNGRLDNSPAEHAFDSDATSHTRDHVTCARDAHRTKSMAGDIKHGASLLGSFILSQKATMHGGAGVSSISDRATCVALNVD